MLKNILSCLPLIVLVSCATDNSWMKDNSRFIDDKTIGELTLPGSHFANAYNIKGNKPLCTGEAIESSNMSINAKLRQSMQKNGTYNQESFIAYLNTQKEDTKQQLNDGIRYLELQVCQQESTFYTSNVYLTNPLGNTLNQIKDFVDSHPEEIVIIDLDNNLWAEYGAMNIQDATKLYNYMISVIGTEMIAKDMRLNTIGELKAKSKQVILMSSNQQLVNFPFVWDRNQTVITMPAEYSTIKKIALIQMAYSQPNSAHNINIIPLYSAIPIYNINNRITGTDSDDPIILNYLSQTLSNHSMVIVTDYKHSDAIIDLTIPNNQVAGK